MKPSNVTPVRALALSIVAALCTAGASGASGADESPSRLNPPAERITDEAIQADHRSFDAVQGRIKALNDGGRRVADYPLAKAQCWLDVSFHEYTRNDRSAFPQAALAEADKLLKAMEAGQSPIPMTTPLVNGAAKLRPDLWALTETLKAKPGFRCSQQKIACAEVELVHAGNEMNQQGWRHAKPYVQIAEDLSADASALDASCPAAPSALLSAPATTPAATTAPRPVELQSNVVFAFDRAGEGDVDPSGIASLHALANGIVRGDIQAVGVRLIGHADRLNGTGQADYNLHLSERRVATVRSMLIALGVPGAIISTQAQGDTRQIVACDKPNITADKSLQACLLPNRRVQVLVSAVERAK